MEQKEFKFCSDRYNNLCFRSPKCLKQTKNNDDLLCKECDDIVLKLQNNCIRSEKRVETLKKNLDMISHYHHQHWRNIKWK